MKPGAAKGAELASGLGAIVLGAGLGLLAPVSLQPLGAWLLAAGVVVHGLGMSLAYRWESRDAPRPGWERGLFWFCWACLVAVAVGAAVAMWPQGPWAIA